MSIRFWLVSWFALFAVVAGVGARQPRVSAGSASSPTFGNQAVHPPRAARNTTHTPTGIGSRTGRAATPQTIGPSAAPAPFVVLSTTSLTFGDQVVNTASTVQTVNLTNDQGVPLNISSIAASSGFAEVNTCGTSVAPATACTISAYFLPTTAGLITGTITITDDAAGSPQTISLSGTGVDAAVITFSNSLYAIPGGVEMLGNQVVGTTSPPQSILLANTGSQPLTNLTILTTEDFGETNDCSSPLPAGASCTIDATFTPSGLGFASGTLTVTGDAPNSPQSVSLEGNGVAAGPIATVPFGILSWKQPINSTPIPEIVPLTNTGTASLTITGISTASPFSETNDCPGSLDAGMSCKITVTVATSTLCEQDDQTLSIDTDGGAVSVELFAVGADGGLAVTDLNSQPAENLATALVGAGVTVSNVKYTGAPIAAGTFSGGMNIVGFDSGIILSSGSATNAIGPNCSDSITGDNNLPGNPFATASIGGDETDDAAALEFDFVPDTSTLTFQYVFASDEYNEYVYQFNDVFGFFVNGKNVALVPGTSLPVSINDVNGGNPVGTDPTDPQLYTDNEFFYPSASPFDTEMDGKTVVLTAQAQVNPGVMNHMTLVVADALDHVLDSHVFIAAGSVSSAAVAFSPPTLGFGTWSVGTMSPSQTATLTYNGSSPLTINSIAASGDFAQTNDCPLSPDTLAPGGSCTLTVTFTPTAVGLRTGAITVTDDAEGSPQILNLSGTGTAPQVVTLLPASLAFTDQQVGTPSMAETLTLSNVPEGSLSITGITITGANAGDFAETDTCGTGLDPGASCTISVTFTPSAVGARSATLSVADDAGNSPQTASLSGAGVAAGPPFTLTPSFTSLTVPQGLSAQCDVAVDPAPGFTGTVGLSCSVDTQPATCTISPTTMTLNGETPSTATFTVKTFAGLGLVPPDGPGRGWPLGGNIGLLLSWLALLLALAALTALRKTPLRRLPALAALLLVIGLCGQAIVGCGGAAGGRGTPLGSHAVTITATSGSQTQTATVTLNVK
jgi:HYDIN/CFA65/VesB-like, Ig-like domain/Abnormal spindle-like microcephaly-assoc'd, ASPM-SPD-2-Hydin